MENHDEIPKVSFVKKQKNRIEFEIIQLSELFSRKNDLKISMEKPHRVEFYHIIFIENGSGKHFIDFQSYNYSSGDVLFISKGQVHAFEIKPETKGVIMLFTETFLSKNLIHSDILSLNRLYNHHLYPPLIKSDDIKTNSFSKIIEEICDEFKKPDDPAKEEILRLFLKLILLKAERIKSGLLPQKKNSEWISKSEIFKKNLEENFHITRNAKDYAKMMSISYKNLNEICKKIAGCTAKEFIDNYIILEIKRQLATSDISIKELTYMSGFDEPTNFIKYFKKHTSKSPTQFKLLISS